MRITFIIPNLGFAGGNRVVAIYADHLSRRGHQVRVIAAAHPKVSFRTKLASILKGRQLPIDIGSAQPYFQDVGIAVEVLGASRPIDDGDVPDGDIVIATWWETAEWVAALSPKKGAKVYFIQHHEVFSYLPVDRARATYRLPLSKIVISKWLMQTMASLYEDNSCFLVLNSVDTDQFFAPPRDKQRVPTVGFLYSTVEFKGPDVLGRALQQLKKQLPATRAIAFGAEKVSDNFPLPDWVEFHFRPPQNEIRSLYGRCDLWLCGSRSEGFHLPPIEAMACRCPVISTKVGGPIDILVDGVNGFLVDVDDASALARKAVELLALPNDKWKSISEAAEQTARRYSWEDATDLFESALLEIAGVSRKA